MLIENTTDHPIVLSLTSKDKDGKIVPGKSINIAAAKGERPTRVNGSAYELGVDHSVESAEVVEFTEKEIEDAKAHDKIVAHWFDVGDLVVGKAKAHKAHVEESAHGHAHKK